MKHLGRVAAALRDAPARPAIAFALSCLERQLPIYERCCHLQPDKVPLRLRACLDRAWEVVREDAVRPHAFDRPTAMEEPEETDDSPETRVINLVEQTAGEFLRAMQGGAWHRTEAVAGTAFALLDILADHAGPATLTGLAEAEARRQTEALAVLHRPGADPNDLFDDATRHDLFGGRWFGDR
jgi:hypothetical protein